MSEKKFNDDASAHGTKREKRRERYACRSRHFFSVDENRGDKGSRKRGDQKRDEDRSRSAIQPHARAELYVAKAETLSEDPDEPQKANRERCCDERIDELIRHNDCEYSGEGYDAWIRDDVGNPERAEIDDHRRDCNCEEK